MMQTLAGAASAHLMTGIVVSGQSELRSEVNIEENRLKKLLLLVYLGKTNISWRLNI
jgi:hypothetical protein